MADAKTYEGMTHKQLVDEARDRGVLRDGMNSAQLRDALRLSDITTTTYHVTFDGVEVDVPGKRLNDFRLIRAMRETQRNQMAVVDVLEVLLGPDYERVCSELADADGYLPFERMSDLLQAVLGATGGEGKNS